MIGRQNITGIILAGGKSSRMGTDKGFQKLNGVRFIERIINVLAPLVRDIIIVSDNKDYDSFGKTRVEDLVKDAGPLAGLYSGLSHSETEINIVLSCDVPMINTETLLQLTDAYDENSDIIQLKSDGKSMPLVAIYKKTCAEDCLKLLQNDERRLRMISKNKITKTIELDPKLDPYVRNINTLEELKELRHEIED